jgi:hypothetical protein
MSRDCTAAMIYELVNGAWKARGRVTSSGGLLAEEWFINDIKGSNSLKVSVGAEVRMEITKSPCCRIDDDDDDESHDCAGQLVKLLADNRLKVLRVVYLGLYNTSSHEGVLEAQSSIGIMANGGVISDVWDWQNDAQMSAAQKNFLTQYQNDFDSGLLGAGHWTNAKTRGDSAKSPETPGYQKYLEDTFMS